MNEGEPKSDDFPQTIEGLSALIKNVQDEAIVFQNADFDPDLEIIMHPDDFPDLESVMGIPIRRSQWMAEIGYAYIVNKKRLAWLM